MIKEKLTLVPKLPGCYMMKNSSGVVIYVGKAKRLQNRLKSYFTGRVTGKTKKLVSEIVDFEYIITSSELEAFILEINLIKKYDPKYNILLKDDKSYPYIEFTNEKYPRLIVKREININKRHSKLFGPYPNSTAARRLVNLINRLYPLKKCDNMPKKECLYYHIGECLGYCINKDIDDSKMSEEIISILNGHDEILINKIKEKIQLHSDNMNYEQALSLKNELDYIKVVFESQKVELNDGINRDIFNYYFDNGYVSIVIFFLRNGKLVESNTKIVPVITTPEEALEYYIIDFYSKRNILPKELIIPEELNLELISNMLDTKVINVYKGIKKQLLDMARKNAKNKYETEEKLLYLNEERNYEANNELKELLHLDKLNRIEIFDNSNLFGTFTVSGMVVFIDGEPAKKEYRKYKLSFDKNDDMASMKEVVYRRYFRVLKDNLERPDLIIMDGGINQINACKSILNDLNMNIKVCGIKKNDKHRSSELIDGDTYKSIELNKESNVFHLITRMSDEVHRYTINYHKQIRSKGSLSSILDEIPGIGTSRKKELIKKYGSLNKIKEQTLPELETILPKNVAETLFNYLKNK